eukprot:jgi/Mesen1/8194/ME000044S07456
MPHVPDDDSGGGMPAGASGGIGRAAALGFGANGAHVVILGRSAERLQPVVEEIEKLGGKGFSVEANLEKPADWERSIRESVEKLGGGLDVLVINGPGTVDVMKAKPDSVEAFQAAMNVNVLATVALVNTALPRLIASKGCVVHVSASAAQRPYPGMAAYCAAKAAADAFVQNYALVYAKKGVRFNSILPGATRTPAMEESKRTFGVEEAVFAKISPNHRLADAAEQAAAILFLSSRAGGYVTGVQLPVDGGFLLTSWSSTSHMLQA